MSADENKDKVLEEHLRYCWLDEAGDRVSPVHADIGKALNWISVWPDHKGRVDRAEAELEAQKDGGRNDGWMRREEQKIKEARKRLSLTGKPPKNLVRLVERKTTEPLSAAEKEVAEQLHPAQGGTDV